MDKRGVKRSIRRFGELKTWQLLVLLALSLLISASFLRLNNIGMIERRTGVYSADKSGDMNAVFNNLYALQRYSASHMNASAGPIYLENTYKQAVEDEINRAKNSVNVNSKAIEKADAACKRQFPAYSQAYVQCNLAEQEKYSAGSAGQTSLVFPNPELYRHNFASPFWSFDFAGFSVLISLLITSVIVVRLIMLGVLKLMLRYYYQSV